MPNDMQGVLSVAEQMMAPRITSQDVLAFIDAHRAGVTFRRQDGQGGWSVTYSRGAWRADAWGGPPAYDFTLEAECQTFTEGMQRMIAHFQARGEA